LHLVGFFFMNCTMMHGSMNIKYMEIVVTAPWGLIEIYSRLEENKNWQQAVMLRTWVTFQLRCSILPHPALHLTYATAHVSQGARSSPLLSSRTVWQVNALVWNVTVWRFVSRHTMAPADWHRLLPCVGALPRETSTRLLTWWMQLIIMSDVERDWCVYTALLNV